MDSTELSNIFQPFYIQSAAIALFYYDYLLTFAAEVSHIWPQPLSINSFLFLCNRYISFFGNIAASIVLFGPISNSTERCSILVIARESLLVLGQIAIASTLATRTIALYGRSRAIIIGVLGFGFLVFAVTCWTLVAGRQVTDTQYILRAPGCRYYIPEKTAIHLAVAWEASALFDVFIFALTLIKTLKMRKERKTASSNGPWGLLDLILRDGALYFFIMALANSANIFSYSFASPQSKNTYTTPAGCIASILCSRLVLNLYDVASQDRTMDSDSFSEPKTTVGILTTRIDLDIPMEHDDRSKVESKWV